MTRAAHLIRTLNAPTPDDFDSNFLEKVKFEDVVRWNSKLRQQRGEVLEVRLTDDDAIWEVITSKGMYRVLAHFDGAGRLSGLRIPTAGLVSTWLVKLQFLFVWFILPMTFLVALHAWREPTQAEWWLSALPDLLFIGVLILTVVWSQTALLLRFLYAVAGVVLLASAARLGHLNAGRVGGFDLAWTLGVSAVLLWVLIGALRGLRAPAHPVRLGQVLTGGTFQVAQGGSTTTLNYHVAHKHMRYAVDLIGVNRWGRHAIGLMPAEPQKYAIFGAQVLAPLDGVVERIRGDLPDLPVPQTDEFRAAGNHIVIKARAEDGREVRVLLAHLQSGSVTVRLGQAIRAGQVIARVGNSGNTTEPHLHLGVNVGGEAGNLLSGEGVPFLIDGRFPFRNLLFSEAFSATD